MELPKVMSYLRDGDKIVHHEERRTTGMTYGPDEVMRIMDHGAWVRTHNCGAIFVVDYQLNDGHRLFLCRDTIHQGDVLLRLTDEAQGVVSRTAKYAATLELPIQQQRILVDWADLDSGWRMLRRGKARKRRRNNRHDLSPLPA